MFLQSVLVDFIQKEDKSRAEPDRLPGEKNRTLPTSARIYYTGY